MVNGVAQPITFYAKTNVNFAALPVGAVAANINLEIWKDIISPIVGAPAPLLAQTLYCYSVFSISLLLTPLTLVQ